MMMFMRSFFLFFFIKAYVVDTHLDCIDKSMQFKWVPTTDAFIKESLLLSDKYKNLKILSVAVVISIFVNLCPAE